MKTRLCLYSILILVMCAFSFLMPQEVTGENHFNNHLMVSAEWPGGKAFVFDIPTGLSTSLETTLLNHPMIDYVRSESSCIKVFAQESMTVEDIEALLVGEGYSGVVINEVSM